MQVPTYDYNYGYLIERYEIDPLKTRREKHILLIMYRHAQDSKDLDTNAPSIYLRNCNKMKFEKRNTALTKEKGPYNRGVSLWDSLPTQEQIATT